MSKADRLDGPRRSTFVVRIDRDDEGNVSGVIERVRTGMKESFRGLDAIGGLIARMVETETWTRPDPMRTPSVSGGPRTSRPDRKPLS